MQILFHFPKVVTEILGLIQTMIQWRNNKESLNYGAKENWHTQWWDAGWGT